MTNSDYVEQLFSAVCSTHCPAVSGCHWDSCFLGEGSNKLGSCRNNEFTWFFTFFAIPSYTNFFKVLFVIRFPSAKFSKTD